VDFGPNAAATPSEALAGIAENGRDGGRTARGTLCWGDGNLDFSQPLKARRKKVEGSSKAFKKGILL